jgi:large subunit ribosomal protein L9
MKVLLRRNVSGLGKIGDLVEVKPGYARNYLVPKGLAVQPSPANVRTVELEKQRYLQQLAHERAEVEARATVIDGKEITIAARANVEGLLYGSVGPAQIVAALAEQGLFLEPENIALDEPIRQLDKYDVEIRLAHDVTATIYVWVVPVREDEEQGEAAPGEDAPAGAQGDEAPGREDQQPEE